MIPAELHKDVHVALLRRKTTDDLWGSPLSNGYVGLVFCSHGAKDEIAIHEVVDYFERNLARPSFLKDPKNLAATALYSAILSKQGLNTKSCEISKLVNTRVHEMQLREPSKYSLLNRPELVYFLALGLSLTGEENLRPSKDALTTSIQDGLETADVESIQRTAFFMGAGLEIGLDIVLALSGFLIRLQLPLLQTYEIIPLAWFLIKYHERINSLLRNNARLKELVPQHVEGVWNQFEARRPYLSLDPPIASVDEEVEGGSTQVLSVLELIMLDDMLVSLELAEGVYPPDLYTMLKLHPVMRRKTEKLFSEGNYNQAISEAYMALIDMVREKADHPKGSDGTELDGTALMERVFSPKKPMLKFNEMRTNPEQDEQLGLMEIFKGAVLAVRNVFHHRSRDEQESPHRTIEYLQLASLLANKLDEAELVPKES